MRGTRGRILVNPHRCDTVAVRRAAHRCRAATVRRASHRCRAAVARQSAHRPTWRICTERLPPLCHHRSRAIKNPRSSKPSPRQADQEVIKKNVIAPPPCPQKRERHTGAAPDRRFPKEKMSDTQHHQTGKRTAGQTLTLLPAPFQTHLPRHQQRHRRSCRHRRRSPSRRWC